MRSLFCLLLVCSLAGAQPPESPGVKIVPRPPAPTWKRLKVATGEQTILGTEDGKPATWVLIDRTNGADLIDNGATATFSAPVAGEYKIVACAEGGKPMLTVVVVGEPAPAPKPPGPAPNPPPAALRDKLKAAWDQDPAPEPKRREQARMLASLYRAAAEFLADPKILTADGFKIRVAETAAKLLKDNADNPTILVALREVVTDEVEKVLPDPVGGAVLTAEQRAAGAERFNQFAQILDSF